MFTIIGADQKEYGPSTAEELRQWIRDGRADGRTLAKREGSGEWQPLASFAEFSDLTAASGAPPRIGAPPATYAPNYSNDPAEQILATDPDFDFGGCLRDGWALLMNNFGLLIGGTFLVWLVGLFVQYIPVANLVLGGVLSGGLYLFYLKRIRGEVATLRDAFAGFGVPFVQLLLTGVVTAILAGLSYFLCVLPYVYLKIAWSFSLALVIDKRLEFWTAMELSRKVTTRVWFKLFALTILVFAPYLLAAGYVNFKTWTLMYPQFNALISGGMQDFPKFLELMKEVVAKTQMLQLAAHGVLLLTLPFATATLMHAYEALFGSRTAPRA